MSATAVTAFDTATLRRGIEQRDATALLSLYADDAEVRMVDRQAQPSHPRVMHGRSEIAAMLGDVCGREMTHRLETVLVDGDHIAYLESCRYPDGARVLASSVADLRDGKIVGQTSVLAWDE